jgi:hypothetical protein
MQRMTGAFADVASPESQDGTTKMSTVGSRRSLLNVLNTEEARLNKPGLALLLRHVAQFRYQLASVLGVDAPKSASLLIDELAKIDDPTSRLMLYGRAVSECLIQGYLPAAERIAVAAHDELRDVVSLDMLSSTLTDVGKPAEGLAYAKAALAQAMSEQVLVNYAAGNLMRRAIGTSSAEAVNEALDALVDSTQVPRTEDCALETDWIDAAEALGADKEITNWVREVANRKGEKT